MSCRRLTPTISPGRRSEAEVEIHADEVTTSDALEFRHEVKVDVTRDGIAMDRPAIATVREAGNRHPPHRKTR